ncbi:MAG TPA: iron ABC transporter permease [Vicinamibacterales bacterium]|jgi:iron(III) transport system permease protein|nr:iron ABC transporter permease [Vicinamibacterales bacterium]
MWGRRSPRALVLGAAVALFLVVCVLPSAYLLAQSLVEGAASFTFETILLDARQRELLVNSALLASGTAIFATLIGATLGVVLARVSVPYKDLVRLALAAPVTLPPYIVGLAWIYVGGSRGILATLVGRDLLSEWTYSLPGVVIVLSVVFYPLSMLATEVAMRGIDGRLEEAALLVATPGRVLRRISLPLALPGVLAATLVIFVLALSEFGVPGLLRVRVYPTEVFTAFAALYDFGRATLLTLPLLAVSIVVAATAGVLVGDRLVATRRGTGVPAFSLDEWRHAALASIIAVITVSLVLPLTVLAREALSARSFLDAMAGSGEAIVNSLILAAAGATAVVALAVWIGYARARSRWGRWADVLLIVLFAMPSTVVGVGLIGLWNRAGPLGELYGTDLMILLAYMARLVPVAALALAAGVRLVPVSQEEAAAVSGAGWCRMLWHIVFPQMTLALGAAWIVAFILAFGELGTTIIVAPPGEATLPIRIYTMIANAPSSQVAGLALLQAGVVFAPLVLLGLASSLTGRR